MAQSPTEDIAFAAEESLSVALSLSFSLATELGRLQREDIINYIYVSKQSIV